MAGVGCISNVIPWTRRNFGHCRLDTKRFSRRFIGIFGLLVSSLKTNSTVITHLETTPVFNRGRFSYVPSFRQRVELLLISGTSGDIFLSAMIASSNVW